MGTYANNEYDVRIPMTAVGPIMAEIRDDIGKGYYEIPAEWKDNTPEALANAISSTFGADELMGVAIEGDMMVLDGFSFGKAHDTQRLSDILAKHGATGTVRSEIDGHGIWLTEFRDGKAYEHEGVVTFPSYSPL